TRNILRVAVASQRVHLGGQASPLAVLVKAPPRPLGHDEAGTDTVHANAVRAVVDRQLPGQRDEGPLGRLVGDGAARGEQAVHRGDGDDRTPAGPLHRRYGVFGPVEGSIVDLAAGEPPVVQPQVAGRPTAL